MKDTPPVHWRVIVTSRDNHIYHAALNETPNR